MPYKVYPAVKHYWFGKAYVDMYATIGDAHGRNTASARHYWEQATQGNWLSKIFFGTAAVVVLVVGTAVWIALIPIHVAIVASIGLAIMVAFGAMAFSEHCYLVFKGWSTVCRHCGEKVPLPEYQCPKCREWHSQLRPSSYGILQHRCRCGQQLPCTFLSSRDKLTSRCCHCARPINAEVDTRSTTSVIALIGPPNSGKTGFMVAAMNSLIYDLAPSRALTARFTDKHSEEFFDSERHAISAGGGTRKTADNKPPAFNALFESSDQRIRHQMFFFDAAGEIYLTTDRMHNHYQFKHITGGVILIDPFNLPTIKQKHGVALRREGLDGLVTEEEAIDVIDRFLIGMQRHFNLKQDRMVTCPYAVVVTKTDLFDLFKELQTTAFAPGATRQQQRQKSSDHIRSCLQSWGAAGLVSQIESRFANTMYFAAAPLRMKMTAGVRKVELANIGVLDTLTWILESAKDPLASQ
jgi:hypothetical protein